MSDPEDDENLNEWIELYNNGTSSIDIANYTIEDDAGLDLILGGKFNGGGTIIPSSTYAILTSETTRVYDNFDIPLNTIKLYVNETRIGKSGLSNSGETLKLYDSNLNLLDQVTYPSVSNGNSYAKFTTWQETSSITPGKNNINNESIIINYSKISITEFLPNPEGNDDSIMPDGEWVEIFNSGLTALDLLGFELYDNLGSDPDIVITNTSTFSGTIINPDSYLIVYTNGVSGFLNNDGFEKIKLYDIYDNLIEEVTYSDSDEAVSWSFSEGKWQKTTPTPGYGNEDNKTSIESEIRIEEIYDLGSDKKAEWGDIIRVKLFTYKGNTNKNVVWMWVENDEERITKKSKFNLYSKFQNYTLAYPLAIPNNCDNEFLSGNYRIIAEGLDYRTEEILEIRDKPLCEGSTKTSRAKNLNYEIKSLPETVSLEQQFTTEIYLRNNQKEDINLDLWSYPYSGKKKFVDEEKENLQSLTLKSSEEKVISLKNTIKDSDKDELNFKIKILRDDRKNPYELKDSIKISKKTPSSPTPKTLKNPLTGYTVYESQGQKAKRSAIFFFNGILALLLIYIVFNHGNTN